MISSADPADLVNRAFVSVMTSIRDDATSRRPADGGDLASYRIALEGAVLAGNSAFTLISAHDTAWHTAVFAGEIEHDPADERGIFDRYRAWLDGCEGLIAAVDLSESCGVAVEGSDELRANRLEARGLLVPDGEFFEGEVLDRLVSEAIAADAGGETKALEEMAG